MQTELKMPLATSLRSCIVRMGLLEITVWACWRLPIIACGQMARSKTVNKSFGHHHHLWCVLYDGLHSMIAYNESC